MSNVTIKKIYDLSQPLFHNCPGWVEYPSTHITRDYHAPHILTRESYRNSFDKLTAAGAYARLGDAYVGKENYEAIMEAYNAAVAEINAPATEEAKAEAVEYETVKTAEVEKETAIINAKPIKRGPGWCDKCQSYCWGDCEAN